MPEQEQFAQGAPDSALINYEEILARLQYKFSLLEEVVEAVLVGSMNGVLIRGRGGIGKTHTVLSLVDLYREGLQVRRFSGHITPLQMYNIMYEFRENDCVLIFDDCDAAFSNTSCMNILKAALDTLPVREITWESNSRQLQAPNSFIFRGRIIVITNAVLDNPHFEAFLDRVMDFHLDLSPQEKIVKIMSVAKSSEEFDAEIGEKVLNWIWQNWPLLGEKLSLRTFVKTVNLAKFSQRWQELARMMVFHKDAK